MAGKSLPPAASGLDRILQPLSGLLAAVLVLAAWLVQDGHPRITRVLLVAAGLFLGRFSWILNTWPSRRRDRRDRRW